MPIEQPKREDLALEDVGSDGTPTLLELSQADGERSGAPTGTGRTTRGRPRGPKMARCPTINEGIPHSLEVRVPVGGNVGAGSVKSVQ